MNILENVRIENLGLFIESEQALVISDLQIGYEEQLTRKGVLVPKTQLKDLSKELTTLLRRVNPKTVVINGDLKHEFGRITRQEWTEVLEILDLILESCNNIVLVKGNHDLVLSPIAEKRNIEVVDSYKTAGVLITHGHETTDLEKDIKTVIIGHDHPAIGLKEHNRTETYKCFLKGKYKGRDLLVLPSFNFLHPGSNILNEKNLSPYLERGIKNFKVYIVEKNKVYDFGKIKDL